MNIQMALTDDGISEAAGRGSSTTLIFDVGQAQRLITLLETLKTQHGDTRDRLIDYREVSWLLWREDQLKYPSFPRPKADKPLRWLRSEVIDWMRHHQHKRIDLAMAWLFISRPIEVRR